MTQKVLLLALGGAALIGAGVGAGTYAAVGGGSTTTTKVVTTPAAASNSNTAPSTSSSVSSQSPLSIGEIYKRDASAVVEITVTTQSTSPFGQSGTSEAQGSGFVYDSQGDIVTDQHVVAGASSISIRFSNGATYKGTLVGSDASSDLAVVKVNAPSSLLQPLSLGDSSGVNVGDPVVAIGSPFGLQGTITSGIVSALHRDITAPNNFTITDTIQTDAAINHGNSGGVLLNGSGQVIGVTAQIQSDSNGNEGVGFAIPSNTIRSIVTQLISSGSVERGFLGVHIQTIPTSAAGQLGVPAGVEITSVTSGSPASKAGIKGATGSEIVSGQQYVTGGDVITAVDGHAVTNADTLQTDIAGRKPGSKVTLTLIRKGSTRTITVTLGTRPS
ncbi:MAG TPA: trypsin-like peptidase domain-containing protein [Gaiellaceae bacterium]|nr:trypsin-like peptidase domain-containing protein [Gaiellaceae bacterium]